MEARVVLAQVCLLAGCLSAPPDGKGGTRDAASDDATPGGTDAAPAGSCLAIDFSEDFGDEDYLARWTESWWAQEGMLMVTGGRGLIVATGADDEYASYQTDSNLDFDQRCVHVEVPVMMKHGDEVATDAYLGVYLGTVEIVLGQSSGDLCCEAHDGMTPLHAECVARYDPEAHRWWRIRFGDGTVSCDVAPDGATWVEVDRYDLTPASLVGALGLFAGTWDPVTSAGQVEFDNLNL